MEFTGLPVNSTTYSFTVYTCEYGGLSFLLSWLLLHPREKIACSGSLERERGTPKVLKC